MAIVTVKKNRQVVNPQQPRVALQRNSALLVTLGASNPKRRQPVKKTVHVHKKKNASSNSSKGRASNPARVVTAPKKTNPMTIAARGVPAKRNPVIFGTTMKPEQLGKAVVGTLVGVAATKLIPPQLPPALTSSQPMRVLISGVVAFGLGMGARKLDTVFGDGVLFGGILQTVSLGLNAYLPSLGSQIALQGGRGVGYVVPGRAGFPENPIINGRNDAMAAVTALPAPAASAAVSGIGRTFNRRRFGA